MSTHRQVTFVRGTSGNVPQHDADRHLDLFVQWFKEAVETRSQQTLAPYRCTIDVIDATTCTARLISGELRGHTLVFDSRSHIDLARLATKTVPVNRPAQVILITGDIPRDEIVFVQKGSSSSQYLLDRIF